MTVHSALDFARRLILVGLCFATSSCGFHVLGDEGEWLGERIGKAADQLRHSPQTELIVSYVPEGGANQRYWIGVGQSAWCPQPPCPGNQTALTVGVERGRHGSTTYHMRFVAVPTRLEIHKAGEATRLILRKNKNVIELVALR